MRNLNPDLAGTFPPPVMEARRWVEGASFPPGRPLLNLSQAAPAHPPPEPLRRAMAEIVLTDPAAHLYGAVLGLAELRARVAADWSRAYGGAVRADQVAITSGCNQAFAAAVATLARAGDNVILPLPYYFNHRMWLDIQGIGCRVFDTGDDLLPDPEVAAALIDGRTRAIVLVSPNNPGGVEYPAEVLAAFRDLARAKGLALIVDETYRDFDSRIDPEGRDGKPDPEGRDGKPDPEGRDGKPDPEGRDGKPAPGGRGAEPPAPHDLFADPDWDDVLIQLYSFSKAYRLTGHRVGAICASTARLAEVEKWLDTVAICPTGLGQRAALWGMENLGDWLAGERRDILERRAAMGTGFAALPDWRVLGCGAYFAYVAHPFGMASDAVARALVEEASLLLLPGTMFGPLVAEGGSGRAEATLRIAYANADLAGIGTLFSRLSEVTARGLRAAG